MNILITGASGFIGSYLFKFFNEKGFNVYGLVRKKTSIKYFNKFSNKLIISDLNDFKKLKKKIPAKIDVIIHSGASNDQDTNKDIAQAYKTNIYGTRNICEIAKIKNVKKFFYFSVLQVYGRELIGKIKENSKITCDNDYSLTHYLAENICEKYSKTINTKFNIMRLGYMFGCPIDKKIDRKTLIPFIFCKQAIEEKKIILASKGKAQRDFVSLKKLGLIIEKKIFKKSKSFEILNIVSSFSFSMREIAQIVSFEASKILKKNIKVKYNTKSKDKKNIFKVFSKIKLYKKKENLLSELKIEVRKLLIMLNEN